MNKNVLAGVVLAVCAAPALADPKDCEELKGEIAAKLDAKGVTNYTLEIVDNATETGATVVGTCQASTKKIVYKRE